MLRTSIALLVMISAGTLSASPQMDVCPVHHVKMTATELRIVYGLPSRAEFDEAEVARKQFPYGRDYVLGGCVLGPRKTVDGFLCPDCVKARKAWLEKHSN